MRVAVLLVLILLSTGRIAEASCRPDDESNSAIDSRTLTLEAPPESAALVVFTRNPDVNLVATQSDFLEATDHWRKYGMYDGHMDGLFDWLFAQMPSPPIHLLDWEFSTLVVLEYLLLELARSDKLHVQSTATGHYFSGSTVESYRCTGIGGRILLSPSGEKIISIVDWIQ